MVNKSLNLFFVCLFLVQLTSCRKELTPINYKNWLDNEENGLLKSKQINEFVYTAQFQTNEYLLLLNKGPHEINDSDINAELENYSDDFKFKFSIENLNLVSPLRYQIQSENEYYGRLQYLNGEVINDCFLVADVDTSACLFAHLDRDFEISPILTLSFSFEKIEFNEKLQFCFNDRIFKNGMIKFSFQKESFDNLPQLIKEK